MYCQSCGTPMGEGVAAVCAECGHGAQRQAVAAEIGNQVRASSKDAVAVLKRLLGDPVGGLGAAYTELGPDRALRAGIAMCLAFALAAAAGIAMGVSQWLGSLSVLMGGSDGFSAFVKLTIQLLILPAAIAAAGLAIRRIAGAQPSAAADLFTAGAALAPLGLAMLLAGMMGARNFEIAALLFFFALAYMILMLYAGFTRVGGMSERAAAPAVPVVLLLAGWLCKAVLASVAGPVF